MTERENNTSDLTYLPQTFSSEARFRNKFSSHSKTAESSKQLIEQSVGVPAKKRVLYVEDYKDTIEVIMRFLTLEGYAVLHTDSIAKAEELVAIEWFDLYLIGDCRPLGSNLELIGRIKAHDFHTPVILYSTQDYEAYIERSKKTGARAFIGKFAEIDYLLDNVRRLIGRLEHAKRLPGAKSKESQ
jgi:DNA-binding NtrC family response regulator